MTTTHDGIARRVHVGPASGSSPLLKLILLGLAALHVLLGVARLPEGTTSYVSGYLGGTLLVYALVYLGLRGLLRLATRPDRVSADRILAVLLLVALVSRIGGGLGRPEESPSDAIVAAHEQRVEELDARIAATDDPDEVAELSELKLESVDRMLAELAESSSGWEREFHEEVAAFSAEVQAEDEAWVATLELVMDDEVLDPANWHDPDELAGHRATVQTYLDATGDALERKARLDEAMRARLAPFGLERPLVSDTLDGMAMGFETVWPLLRRALEANEDLARAILETMDLLGSDLDGWQVEGGEFVIDDPELYDAYVEAVEAWDEAQARMLATSEQLLRAG